MSCCGNRNNKYYTRQNFGKNCCENKKENCCTHKNTCCNDKYEDYTVYDRYNNNDYFDSDYSNLNSLNGISCPFHNNNDRCCEKSLRDALCQLTNQRVIIHTDGCKMCVVIVSVGHCFIKTINPCTHRIVYFNINRIDNVEDILPRCY